MDIFSEETFSLNSDFLPKDTVSFTWIFAFQSSEYPHALFIPKMIL
jgi:hypothetical protein